MKTKLLVLLLMLALNLPLLAQTKATNLSSSIVGTWKMISQTGTNTDGTPFKMDLAKGKQYKIITPTHWMFVSYDTDSLKGGGDGGTYVLKENKYVETINDAKTDFTVKVEGDKFYQDGAIILPDGKKIQLHEVYQRIAEPTNRNTDLVGTWNMVSNYDLKEGKKVPSTGLTELQILTPAHYMWVSKKAGKMEAAMFGTYTREGNKIIPIPTIATFPVGKGEKVGINITDLKPELVSFLGKLTFPDGKTQEWGVTYQRVGKANLMKVVSK